ncbi:endolytic transglycosylase MltG [Elusimicrobiota bacterium]
MGKKLINSRWIGLSILIVVLFAVLIWYGSIPRTFIDIDIPANYNGKQIAQILHNSDLISSKDLFFKMAILTGNSKKLKAGKYSIPARAGIFRILNMISKGKTKKYKLVVPEGFTANQIAETLLNDGIADKNDFLKIVREKNLEGYLFPQTYFFEYGVTAGEIVDTMLEQFEKMYTEDLKKKAKELKMSDRNIIILASIIEKEAVLEAERPRISAVFHNRLKQRHHLESCATVLYALGKHKSQLLYKDLQVDSPYNTYIHYGLPPGPISNPGIKSIKAALNPSDTKELFFVVSSSGAHNFSTSFRQHVENKKKKPKH